MGADSETWLPAAGPFVIERILADLVVVLHATFIVFAACGGLLALRWRWIPWLQLPAAAWGVAVELCHGVCPLTPLENALRRASGAAGYPGGFVEHYLLPAIYPAGLTAAHQVLLGGTVVVANAGIYAWLWRRSRARLARAVPWSGEAFLRGVELWNRGEFWEAHEAWEGPWRAAGRDTPLGRFLQGLILLAAAGVKHERGAREPARRLAARGARRIGAAGPVEPPFDAPAFAAAVERWVGGRDPEPPTLRMLPPDRH
jgi:hypothetical protein